MHQHHEMKNCNEICDVLDMLVMLAPGQRAAQPEVQKKQQKSLNFSSSVINAKMITVLCCIEQFNITN